MASLNKSTKASPLFTHEGGNAYLHLKPHQMLRRSVLSCFLWEDEFYEDGQSIAQRIRDISHQCDFRFVGDLAITARTDYKLRHVPLLLLCSLFDHPRRTRSENVGRCKDYIRDTIQRADELTEILAIYWKDKKKPLPGQLKKGLALAFQKFSAYALAKYNRDNAIKLRDVLFLSHPNPKDKEQAEVWKKLAEKTLESPDTWEVALSGGADKKETFTRLITEGKLGYLALLRNLRNMEQAGCDMKFVGDAILARKNGAEMVLPFRFIAAARACPHMERQLDQSMLQTISNLPKLSGRTVVVVDVSVSMDTKLSGKSDLTRIDAASALASIINSDDLYVYSFSNNLVSVPSRRGMAGVDAIIKSQIHSNTHLARSIEQLHQTLKSYDRIIVITDEQSQDGVINPLPNSKAYMINVGSYRNGVGYGRWTHIDGFSERVLEYIVELENS